MCRTETMTGQTDRHDSGRYFTDGCTCGPGTRTRPAPAGMPAGGRRSRGNITERALGQMMDISGKTRSFTPPKPPRAASGQRPRHLRRRWRRPAPTGHGRYPEGCVEEAAHGISGTNKGVMPVRIDVSRRIRASMPGRAANKFGKLHIA